MMWNILKTCAVIVILSGCFLGVRYLGALIHYGCAEPGADGPPPLCAMGNLGFYLTGGELLPLWTQNT